ncbi:MAG: TatD family hydrolase [Candidatus Omnitrophica bacterium]|nr:TatD family hydrolase [Candidatus Omnitrophota bacterium]
MLVDTHCHLDLEQFADDRAAVIERARASGIGWLLNVAVCLKSCETTLELSRRHEDVFASLGVHPHYADTVNEDAFVRIKGWLGQKKVKAVGEIGLDFYRNLSSVVSQMQHLRAFIGLALEFDLPVILHCRNAYKELLAVLDEFHNAGLRGVFHCFSGTGEDMACLLERGFSVSFCGNLTYPGNTALRDILKEVPLERLLLETDSPYLAPHLRRGERNEPAFLRETAQAMADIKGITLEDFARCTTQNAAALFRIEGI